MTFKSNAYPRISSSSSSSSNAVSVLCFDLFALLFDSFSIPLTAVFTESLSHFFISRSSALVWVQTTFPIAATTATIEITRAAMSIGTSCQEEGTSDARILTIETRRCTHCVVCMQQLRSGSSVMGGMPTGRRLRRIELGRPGNFNDVTHNISCHVFLSATRCSVLPAETDWSGMNEKEAHPSLHPNEPRSDIWRCAI